MTVNVQKRRRYRVRRMTRELPTEREMSPGRRLYMLLTVIAAAGVFAGAYSYSGGGVNGGGGSYTHLALPGKRRGEVLGGVGAFKKKK